MIFQPADKFTHCCGCKLLNIPTIWFNCTLAANDADINLCIDCLQKAQQLFTAEGVLPCVK